MNCPTCGSDKVVLHCEKCGHNWDDGRLEALEEVAKAANVYICAAYRPVYRRNLIKALKALEE